MKTHTHKLIWIVLLLLCSLCILSACGSTDTATEQDAVQETEQETEEAAEEETTEKIVVTMARYGTGTLPVVVEFNESQDTYVIEMVDYSADKSISREDARKKLNTELVTGGGTDLIDLWGLQMDVEIYGPKGYLEDLTTWLASDEDLSEEDLVQSFVEAYKIDGAMYGAVPGFGIMTILTGESVAERLGDNWSFSTLTQLAQETGSAAGLFTTETRNTAFLESALACCAGDYWDLNALTCDFESEQYAQLLEFCGMLPDDVATMVDASDALFSRYVVQSFLDWQYYEAIWGEDVVAVGYPSESGEGSCIANMMEQYGINYYSDCKEGAWEFIKYVLSEEYQTAHYAGYQFPTNQAAMDTAIERAMTREAEDPSDYGGTNIDDFAYQAATQAQIDATLAMIDGATRIYRMDTTASEIAVEEAADYFSGQKTIEQVAEITQNRVTTYLEEQQ